MNFKRILELDFVLFFSIIFLSLFGILFIYSSSVTAAGVSVSNEYIRQAIWFVLGLSVCVIFALFDYRRLYDLSGYFYIAVLLLLVYTRLFGKVVNGARAWIGVGIFGIQPSELAKIATILYLAKFLDATQHTKEVLNRFLFSGLIIALPVSLIIIQPDLGTTLVFIPIFLAMIFIAGIPIRYIIAIILFIFFGSILTVLPLWQSYIMHGSLSIITLLSNLKIVGLISVFLILIDAIAYYGLKKYQKKYFFYIAYISSILILSLLFSFVARTVLKEYQIMRLIVFIDPNIDPKGSGWNIIQSVTAIGSGGFFGKGFLQGTQSHYQFLPEQSTDFIFSIFSEEWGFLGGFIVFLLYFLISFRIMKSIRLTADPYGAYICSGIVSIIVFHFIINIGMTMGIMPITGIPLLFMSYGGSSLIAIMMGLGISMSVYMRRFEH